MKNCGKEKQCIIRRECLDYLLNFRHKREVEVSCLLLMGDDCSARDGEKLAKLVKCRKFGGLSGNAVEFLRKGGNIIVICGVHYLMCI